MNSNPSFRRPICHSAFVCALLTWFLLLQPQSLLALGGTYTVSETWSVTLTYTDWGSQRYTGVQHFSGTQVGTIEISTNRFTMLDQTGIPHDPPAGVTKTRTLYFDGSPFSIYGDKVMPYILAGASLNGIFYLGAFMVTVPIVDGEIPVFNRYTPYHTSGSLDSSMTGAGSMQGSMLTIDASSTLNWTPLAGPPQIISYSLSRAVLPGASVDFFIEAIGNPTPTYQWQRLPAGSFVWADLANGVNYFGVATPTMTVINTVETMNGDQFRCLVSNNLGSTTSGAVTLTVGTPPLITAQPHNQTVMVWDSAMFAITATGSPSTSFQWQRKPEGSSTWINLGNSAGYSGVLTSTLLITNSTLGMNGDQFRCVVQNGLGSATSNPALLTVNPPPPILLFNPSLSGNSFSLEFSTIAGMPYRVEFVDNLRSGVWLPLPGYDNLLGTGSPQTITDPLSRATNRFYRVVQSF